jgi:hypothetical protein
MIAKSPADEIAGQAGRIYPRDEPSLPVQWRFLEMYTGDVPATFASPDLLA